MSKLSAFTFITLDGYYKGPEDDIGWHTHGEEETQFSEEMLSLGNILVFGRRTYEMMADFWTTDMAMDLFPRVAEGMNKAEKIVFSTQIPPDEFWENTRFISGNLAEAVKQLRQHEKKDMTILGSGSVVRQLAGQNLIDEYQIMIDPVLLGNGTSLFEGTGHSFNLELIESRTFSDGVILLKYKAQ